MPNCFITVEARIARGMVWFNSMIHGITQKIGAWYDREWISLIFLNRALVSLIIYRRAWVNFGGVEGGKFISPNKSLLVTLPNYAASAF